MFSDIAFDLNDARQIRRFSFQGKTDNDSCIRTIDHAKFEVKSDSSPFRRIVRFAKWVPKALKRFAQMCRANVAVISLALLTRYRFHVTPDWTAIRHQNFSV